MPKALKILLILLLFVGFFEVGLFCSYTMVTSEVPDVVGLVNLQIDAINNFFNSQNVNKALIKDPNSVSIDNVNNVAKKIEEISKVDGINVDSMNITTVEDTKSDSFNVKIETLGYSSPDLKSNQIVISQKPSYKVISTANATNQNGRIIVDVDSIKIDSILKLYGG